MSDLNSSNTNGIPADQAAHDQAAFNRAGAASVRIVSGVTRVTSSGGNHSVYGETGSGGVMRYSGSAEAIPEGNLLAGRNSFGAPTTDLSPDSVVEYEGMEVRVRELEAIGVVRKTADGYVKVDQQAPEATPQADPDAVEFHPTIQADLDQAIGPIPQHAYDHAAATLLNSLDIADLNVGQLASASGISVQEASNAVNVTRAAFTAVATKAITSVGVQPADAQAAFEWAAEHRPDLARGAIKDLIFGGSTAAVKELGKAYLRSNTPDSASLKANGIEVTKRGGEELINVGGVQMTTAIAARLGFI